MRVRDNTIENCIIRTRTKTTCLLYFSSQCRVPHQKASFHGWEWRAHLSGSNPRRHSTVHFGFHCGRGFSVTGSLEAWLLVIGSLNFRRWSWGVFLHCLALFHCCLEFWGTAEEQLQCNHAPSDVHVKILMTHASLVISSWHEVAVFSRASI